MAKQPSAAPYTPPSLAAASPGYTQAAPAVTTPAAATPTTQPQTFDQINQEVPSTLNPVQIMNEGAAAESQLPSWLQLSNEGNPLNPAGTSAYQQNYEQQNVAPQTQQLISQLGNNGQSFGSYAGGLVGQQMASGDLQSLNAGLQYAQQYYNDQLSGRQSYFAGGPQVAANQNALAVNRGLGIANATNSAASTAGSNAANANSYNLGTASLNDNYNLSNASMGNTFSTAASGQANNYNAANFGTQASMYNANENAIARFA